MLELRVEAANGLKARQWLSTFLNSQNSNNIQVIFKVKPETANVQFFFPALLLGINTACRRNENIRSENEFRDVQIVFYPLRIRNNCAASRKHGKTSVHL